MAKEHESLIGTLVALSLLVSTPAWATGSVLSGMFDGSEPVIDPLIPGDCNLSPVGYRDVSFAVSDSGTYSVHDALGAFRYSGGLNVNAQIHEGSFDPSNPVHNVLVAGEFDFGNTQLDLVSGTNYVLVVQHACTPKDGAWAVMITGPGAVISDSLVQGPSFTSGAFVGGEPKIDNFCHQTLNTFPSNAAYRQTGPVRVSRDGTYYFSSANRFPAANRQSLCLSVYDAPINPAAPSSNLIAAHSGVGTMNLKAGQDYYFLMLNGDTTPASEYFFVLAPPAPFRINPGLTDSWFNPETPGQGFFLDVFESLNQVFLGWFTFADGPTPSSDGEHRWMTALGNFQGASAELEIEWAAGGAFNATNPVPDQYVDGTIQLEFEDCASGQVSYNFGGGASGLPPASGVIPIRRIVNDAVELCEALYAGPGLPGPL